ncbi:fibrillin-1-like [Ylistrum balloti]|uniref:fibrillin-1-like n=1 Tax=Ylistrum balloti TaxID=509963 RepID=UPI002905CF70|nr:fibrillin-1-like [Ylistrum balloti]
MYLTSLSVVCVLSLVSGNVLYFKPQHQQDDVVMEFDQVPEDSPDIIVYDPVEGHESRVPMKVEASVNERPFRSVMCPDGMSECQNDNTCCKLSNGHYGCCPFPDAVCCSDMKHCCRQGFTCNLSKGRCEQGNSYMPLISKLPASKPINQQNKKTGSPRLSEAQMIADPLEICPGGEHACQGGYSCCINTNGTHSCCGYSPALCCEDKVHCCPANYKCLSTGLCEDRNGFQLPRSRKVEATNIKVKANIVCPDKTQCAAGQTCCMKGVNIYGCCPLQKAVCCADRKHCCPFGYKCGTKVGTCMQGYHIIDLSVENNHDISREITTDLKVVAEEIMQSSVICPDKSQCMTGQTCCQGISGSYGCCPVPNAVCCTDKKHCCPEGHKCETSIGKCVKGDHLMDWLEKESNSMSITYQGVCCGDKDGHCCPMGYICNVQERNCRKEGTDEVIQWLTKMKINSLSVRNVVCPDGRSECPTGNTCCLGEEGKYGCCPQPNAVCCADKKHCCPNGYTCETGSGKCTRNNAISIEWLEKTESRPVGSSAVDVICPDGHSECKSGSTCCLIEGNKYGCCPVPNAVCCADKKHCCPNGYTCETGSGKCTRNNAIAIEWLEKTESRPVGSSAVDVICPDGHSECKSGSTCCLIEGNKYGCCPVPNAVCCADKKHCCPNGYTCETGSGKCTRNNAIAIEWLEKTESRPVGSSAVDVICPDGHSECKSGSTCCLIEGNKYGCCPVPNAVCCADKKHCCPNGYTCETGSGKCTRNNAISIEWLEKTESRPVGSSAVDVICPDGHSECKSGSTCCLIEGNKYGCCPVPNAVCCADKKHCCPNGYTCETGSGKCTRNNAIAIEWLEKTESRPVGSSAVDVICPDGHSECKSGSTCCLIEGNKYGCCPVPNAVCCADKKHCCPNGYTCETGSGKCTRNNAIAIEWLEKTESRPVGSSAVDVICPDGHSECKSGSTCCLIEGNKYGCCPVPNAVCCADKKHCCPNGYTCETGSGKCTRNNAISIEWLEKTESRPVGSSAVDVICPDGHSECKSGSTCCLIEGNKYGCCPVPNAVCCADKKHCCPNGYTCETGSGKCTRNNAIAIEWLEKTESRPVGSSAVDVICPDGHSECKSGSTCCLIEGNKYGCCPVPNAVCCADKKHCCPNGYTCETGSGKCTRNNAIAIEWLEKTESRPVGSSAVDVICPDGHSECKSGSTCCLIEGNKYGCCPVPNAVCCADKKHCCPNGYTCETGSGKCTRNNAISIEWLEKTESRPVGSSAVDVICPDGHSECKSGSTCCLIEGNKYGCCPVPNAVCCADKKHCCPNGYTCETGSGKCTRNNAIAIEWLEKTESRPVGSSAVDVICPDGHSECKSGSTCCLIEGNKYGCCPVPNAVCCADKKHCCPNGYTCETGSGKCTRNNAISIEWLEKTESRPVGSSAVDVICPDGHSECKSGSTCCLIEGNKYGCCPVPNAVCCADKKHCCPSGYTCETGSGKCTRNNAISIEWLEKTESRPVGSSAVDVICPDGHSECKSGSTCCLIEGNKYGCCPVPNAVCCADKKHCCPSGYTCETGSGKCTRNNAISIEWLEKTESRPVGSSAVDVICPDGHSECKSGSTCCLIEGNKYGCCPVPNAVCCADKKHCCPNGYTCETGSGKCTRNNAISIEWLEKTESRPVASTLSIICPDMKTECPSGNTCCLDEEGTYACCPRPNAVCCSDKKHCCPENTECDTSSGKCISENDLSMDWLQMHESVLIQNHYPISAKIVPAISVEHDSSSIDCPGGGSCPSDNTCCKNSSGNYGCCSYAKAICCPDGKYCCPHGYICDTEPMICRMPEGSKRQDFNTNLFLQHVVNKHRQRGGNN